MNIYQLGDKKPQLPPPGQYWIAPSAIVLGDVILKKNASVWFGAVLRGDNDPIVIGENTNIQDGAVLHSDPGLPLTLGNDVTVGHMAMIHSCDVGDQSLIGIGAVVLARVRIGRNSIVGAGALIPEGKEFPDGVLILGAPARVARQLGEGEIMALKGSAEHYVANWKRYVTDLSPAW
jgi:carbonic anhydrase/acetyltransferase-like protein (isoleucine patch superfamily)